MQSLTYSCFIGLSGYLMNKVLRLFFVYEIPAVFGLSGYLMNKVLRPSFSILPTSNSLSGYLMNKVLRLIWIIIRSHS